MRILKFVMSLPPNGRYTCDLGSKGTPRDVLIIELHDDGVVSGSSREVGHGACAIFVVFAGDHCFRWALHSQ